VSASAVPPDLEPKVFELFGQGRTTRQIAEVLKAEHGISVHHTTVSRLLRKQREVRAAVFEDVIREKVERSVGADLDLLARETKRLEEELPKVIGKDFDQYLRGLHALCRIVDRRFEIAGIVNPKKGKKTLEDLLDEDDGAPGEVDARGPEA
jgi:hypothetical protein